MAEDKLNVEQTWKRLLEARSLYEGAREQLKNLHLGTRPESGQRKQQLVEYFEKQRDESSSDIETCMLVYQEAARARDSESSTRMSQTMKVWTIVVGVAAVAQTLAAVVQLWHGWGH